MDLGLGCPGLLGFRRSGWGGFLTCCLRLNAGMLSRVCECKTDGHPVMIGGRPDSFRLGAAVSGKPRYLPGQVRQKLSDAESSGSPESQPADDSRFAREGGGIRRFADKLKDSLNLARHRASNAVQLCMCTCTALVRDGSQYLIYSLSWLRPRTTQVRIGRCNLCVC